MMGHGFKSTGRALDNNSLKTVGLKGDFQKHSKNMRCMLGAPVPKSLFDSYQTAIF